MGHTFSVRNETNWRIVLLTLERGFKILTSSSFSAIKINSAQRLLSLGRFLMAPHIFQREVFGSFYKTFITYIPAWINKKGGNNKFQIPNSHRKYVSFSHCLELMNKFANPCQESVVITGWLGCFRKKKKMKKKNSCKTMPNWTICLPWLIRRNCQIPLQRNDGKTCLIISNLHLQLRTEKWLSIPRLLPSFFNNLANIV